MRAAAVKRLAARMTQIGDCRRPAVYGIMSLAGRDISVSHDALGTARVMRTGGMMGEVVGYAAKYCVRYGCDPRGVYESHLEEFIAELKALPRLKKNRLVANVHECAFTARMIFPLPGPGNPVRTARCFRP